jgi:hypothetical protein
MTENVEATAKKSGFIARWSRIGQHAASARSRRGLFKAALIIAVTYNILGVLDIFSTIAGLQAQLGVEKNPIIRLAMDLLQNGWIVLKLSLQFLVTAMILWFPHRFVLVLFSIAMMLTALAVYNNLQIAGFI